MSECGIYTTLILQLNKVSTFTQTKYELKWII
jgi:hypothetical protein